LILSKHILNNYLPKFLFLSLLASTAFAYSGGTGDSNSPYQIASVSDWQQLMTSSADWNKNFILIADVNLQGIILTPVGDYTTNFTGVFDGNNHIISNVDINTPDNGCVGLFGYICTGAQIRNLGIEDVNINGSYYVGGLVGGNYGGSIINCHSTGMVSGFDNIGGLVGCNNTGSITNSYSTGAVSGYHNIGGLMGGNYGYSTVTSCCSAGSVSGYSDSQYIGGLIGCSDRSNIQNCHSTATVSGVSNSRYIGGLVGYCNYGSVTNSYSTGNVSGDSDSRCIGGLVGDNYGSITDSYSTGTVSGASNSRCIGGLAGSNSWTITNCYSTGAVSGSDFAGYISGLVGYNYQGSINNCYSTGTVSGSSGSYNIGGLVGYNYFSSIVNASFWDANSSGQSISAGGTGKTTAQMKTLSTFTSAGWYFSYTDGEAVWFMPINEYPILTWQISDADIYTDGKNNFRDFAVLARFWMRDDCRMYNHFCDFADLNFDGVVDIDDLKEFASYWLQSGIYN
jgi:hypothetical protein